MKIWKFNYFVIIAVAALLAFSACEGPAGPQGPEGPTGPAGKDGTSGDILEDILTQLNYARQQGGASNGTTEAKAFTFKPEGFGLIDDVAMKALYYAVQDYWIHLDLSGLTGTVYFYNPLADDGIDKSKILSVTLHNWVSVITDGMSSAYGAFSGFTGMKTFKGDGIVKVGIYTFSNCTSLQSISLPFAENISFGAFWGCTTLTSVSLPAATSIGNSVFRETGTQALIVTLGHTAPTVGYSMFVSVEATKNVTVRVPAGATGYDTNWESGFKGRGWDGTTFGTGSLNNNINLTIEYMP